MVFQSDCAKPLALIDLILADGRCDPAARPINYLYVVFADWLIPALHHVFHVSIGAILCSINHRRKPSMAQLIQIVLNTPILSPHRRITFTDLAGKDLIRGVAVRVADDVAFWVAEHGFAHYECSISLRFSLTVLCTY